MQSYRAIVVGATGAVGSALVRELLRSPRCAAVTILVRREVDTWRGAEGAAKLTSRVVDVANLERDALEPSRGCDAAFCTLGVGQPRKVPKEEVWEVEVEYTSAFARACKEAGVRHISMLGSVGTDAGSSVELLRYKASAEERMRSLGFPRTSFFRPSLLVTKEIRYGLQDRVTQFAFPLVSGLLPSRYREIRVEDLARAMRVNAERPAGDRAVEILYHDDFEALIASEVADR